MLKLSPVYPLYNDLYYDLYFGIERGADLGKRNLTFAEYKQLSYIFGEGCIDCKVFITKAMAEYMRSFGLNVSLDEYGQYRLEV